MLLGGSRLGDRTGLLSATGTSLYAPPGRGQWTLAGRTLDAPWTHPGRTLDAAGGPGMQPALEPSAQTSPANLERGVYLGWFPRARGRRGMARGALESKCGHWLRLRREGSSPHMPVVGA